MLANRRHVVHQTTSDILCTPYLRQTRAVRCHANVSGPSQLPPEQQQQQQQSVAAATASIRQLLTRRSYAPPRYVGPIQVAQVPDKRFGLTATRNLAVGDLLLVTPPLAVAFGPAGQPPSNEELQQQLEGAQLEPWQAAWLRALHREPAPAAAAAEAAAANATNMFGAAAAATAGTDHNQLQQQQLVFDQDEQQLLAAAAAVLADETAAASEGELLPLLQNLLLHGPEAPAPPPHTPAAAPTAAAAAADVSIVSVTCPCSAQELQQIISGNAYGEAAEDLGAALLRELDPEAVAGIWPEYALLNHSCVPNTLAACVGRYLLLHVTVAVLQGEELTCSYLGDKTFSPVGVRRAFLQGVYGFHCVCERCIAEQRTFPTQYYPADDAILGLRSSSSSSSSSSGGVLSLLSPFAGLLGGQAGQQGAAAAGKPTPSPRHRLLQQQYEAVQLELRPAVQAAATADSRRQEQQLQLLAQVTDAIDTLQAEVAAAVSGDAALAWQAGAANRWLLASALPLLQLQVELLELLLASGGLPVDEKQALLDEAASYSSSSSGSGSSSSSSSSRAMSAAGAAAAAKFALNPGSSRRRRRPKNLPGWLSGLVGALQGDQQAAGPVTKRQLLGLYAESLGRVVGVLDAVARGSEAQVTASIKHMDAVRQCVGPDSEETAMAEGLCSRAHAARYGVQRGPEGQALVARLISARRRQLLGASLARKMSVLAWEAATAR